MSPPPPIDQEMPIRSATDVVQVRQAVRTAAVGLGFSLVEQTKIVTAASELARNTFEHGGGGTARVQTIAQGLKRGLRLTFADHGPGIADVALAMTDGYTTGQGMGLGLSGSKRLVSEFELDTAVGRGTTVTVTRWK